MNPCEEKNPYEVYTNPEFIKSQEKQRECLAVATGFDWSKLEPILYAASMSIGLVTNPRPASDGLMIPVRSISRSWTKLREEELC